MGIARTAGVTYLHAIGVGIFGRFANCYAKAAGK